MARPIDQADASKWMHSEIRDVHGRLVYVENLYDGGKLVAGNEIDCGPTPPVAKAPEPQTRAAATAAAD